MSQKKRGRKKKRGPKKKLPPKVYKGYNRWNYKVISCRNGRQVGYIGRYLTPAKAYEEVKKLLEKSKAVIFPRKTVNSKKSEDSVDEYLILEKVYGEPKTALLRNDYGKLVEHRTSSPKWVILDKFRFQEEETFWVYGYDPKTSRKTFTWIYENLLVNQINGKYDIKRISVYNNKLIIKDDYANTDLIICKTRSDAIRFYNLLQQKAAHDKLNQIYFMGAYYGKSLRTTKIIDELCELTGWDRRKITRISTNTK